MPLPSMADDAGASGSFDPPPQRNRLGKNIP
jgi:hypothetical protein